MDQHSCSLAKHSPAWTDPEAQLGIDSPHSQWSCRVVTGTFSCGLRGCGSKLSSQPEQPLKQLPTKPTGTSWGSCPAVSQRLLTEKPRELQAVRDCGFSAHTKPAALLQQHLLVCSTLCQHTGQPPTGESLSVPTAMGSSHH